MSILLGSLSILVSMALWAYAARASLRTDAPAFTSRLLWVAGVPYAVTGATVIGMAFVWQAASTLPEPANWLVGGGAALMVPAGYMVFTRLLGVPQLYGQTVSRLKASPSALPAGDGLRRAPRAVQPELPPQPSAPAAGSRRRKAA